MPDVDDTAGFVEQYRDFMEVRRRGRPVSPTGLIEQWGSFVEECESGYDLNIGEFWNDLRVRRLIAEMLRNPELAKYRQTEWVRAEIDAIDDRYRALLVQREVRRGASWWEARVPRFRRADIG